MAVHKSQWRLAKIHSWEWKQFLHNLNMLLICHWFILSLSRCCDFDSSCCFPSAPLLFWLCSSRVFACSLQLHSQFCCSSLCPARGWVAWPLFEPTWEQRPGNGRYREKIEMKERDALSGRELKKEAEISVHRQMMATLVWKSPLYSQDSWGERATIPLPR